MYTVLLFMALNFASAASDSDKGSSQKPVYVSDHADGHRGTYITQSPTNTFEALQEFLNKKDAETVCSLMDRLFAPKEQWACDPQDGWKSYYQKAKQALLNSKWFKEKGASECQRVNINRELLDLEVKQARTPSDYLQIARKYPFRKEGIRAAVYLFQSELELGNYLLASMGLNEILNRTREISPLLSRRERAVTLFKTSLAEKRAFQNKDDSAALVHFQKSFDEIHEELLRNKTQSPSDSFDQFIDQIAGLLKRKTGKNSVTSTEIEQEIKVSFSAPIDFLNSEKKREENLVEELLGSKRLRNIAEKFGIGSERINYLTEVNEYLMQNAHDDLNRLFLRNLETAISKLESNGLKAETPKFQKVADGYYMRNVTELRKTLESHAVPVQMCSEYKRLLPTNRLFIADSAVVGISFHSDKFSASELAEIADLPSNIHVVSISGHLEKPSIESMEEIFRRKNLNRLTIKSATEFSTNHLKEIGLLSQSLSSLELPNTVVFDSELADNLRTLEQLSDLKLKNNPSVKDEIVIKLSLIPKLQSVDLTGAPLTEKSMKAIGKISALWELNLSETPIKSEDLDHLANNNVRALYLDGTKVSDDALKYFKKLPNLYHLSLGKTDVSEEGLLKLLEMGNLRYLDLVGSKISEPTLVKLYRGVNVQTVRH